MNDFFTRNIGFEKLFELSNLTKYPPYNVVKVSDNRYVIEMAIAGFAKQDIDIEIKGDSLIVNGMTTSNPFTEDYKYLYKGISDKAFTRQFTLADNVEVKGADMINGLLKIWLETVSKTKDSKKVEIN